MIKTEEEKSHTSGKILQSQFEIFENVSFGFGKVSWIKLAKLMENVKQALDMRKLSAWQFIVIRRICLQIFRWLRNII